MKREIRVIARNPIRMWMLFIALAFTACGDQSASTTSSSPSPAPEPSPSTCWIYDEMFPATKAAFDAQHVTPSGRREIELFASPSTPARLRLAKTYSSFATLPSAAQVPDVRWMREGWSRELVIFVEGPKDDYWSVLNTNAVIDTEDCSVVPVPGG